MGVICEEQSQTNRSFVLTSAQLFRPDEHDLANSVRNGDGLLSVEATFLLRRSSFLRADRQSTDKFLSRAVLSFSV